MAFSVSWPRLTLCVNWRTEDPRRRNCTWSAVYPVRASPATSWLSIFAAAAGRRPPVLVHAPISAFPPFRACPPEPRSRGGRSSAAASTHWAAVTTAEDSRPPRTASSWRSGIFAGPRDLRRGRSGCSDGAPRSGRKRERPVRAVEPACELGSQRGLALRLERRRVGARRADAGRERLPEVVKVLVRSLDDERGHSDLREPCVGPELAELVRRREAHQGSLVGGLGVEGGSRVPKGAQHRHLAAVVPDAAGEDACVPRDPHQLAHAAL